MNEVQEKIERLRGHVAAMEALMNALLRAVPRSVLGHLEAGYHEEVGELRTSLQDLHASAHALDAFERTAQSWSAKLNTIVQGESEN